MPRGRPRKFNEDEALTGAMLMFWEKGMSATSLDDLTDAMSMNRPSIYNTFGNKEDIYRNALALFCGQLDEVFKITIGQSPNTRSGLIAFFNQAIDVYCGGEVPLGCLMICTAPAESISHPEVGEDLKSLISRLDEGLTQRLETAKKSGEISDHVDSRLAAKLLQGTLQTLAIRARAGESKRALRRLARYAVDALTR